MKVLALFGLIMLTGCATIGRDFTFNSPSDIVTGKTTQEMVIKKYGSPFRVGYDNGLTQWTYARYIYSLFGDAKTKDLVITFNTDRTVKSYTYNSSLEDDKMKLMSR